MRRITFDIETRNLFADVGKNDPTLLDIALVAIHDSATDQYYSYLAEELPQLWPIIERADLLIGFNSDHFDLPLLNKYYPGDLTLLKSIDLLKEIKAVYGRRMRLDQLAEGTLGKKKSGHGFEAITWWKKGEIDKIRTYCIDDVKITKELYDYAREHQKLLFKEAGEILEIPLETSGWEDAAPSPLTFTLPF